MLPKTFVQTLISNSYGRLKKWEKDRIPPLTKIQPGVFDHVHLITCMYQGHFNN